MTKYKDYNIMSIMPVWIRRQSQDMNYLLFLVSHHLLKNNNNLGEKYGDHNIDQLFHLKMLYDSGNDTPKEQSENICFWRTCLWNTIPQH